MELTSVAIMALMVSNAAALWQAAVWRRRYLALVAVAYALTPDGKPVTFWPCDCKHLLLWERVQEKVCCDTRHTGRLCQPIGETL